MSRENVEVARRAFEEMNARNAEAIGDLVTPDVEWRPVLTAGGDLEAPVYRGTAGIVQYWTDLDELFENTQVQVEDLAPIGPSHVLFGGRVTARGRKSGVPLDEHIWALWELRNGRLYRGAAFRSRAEAIAATGVSRG
jgi:ketosteroid isomerase-like protein